MEALRRALRTAGGVFKWVLYFVFALIIIGMVSLLLHITFICYALHPVIGIIVGIALFGGFIGALAELVKPRR